MYQRKGQKGGSKGGREKTHLPPQTLSEAVPSRTLPSPVTYFAPVPHSPAGTGTEVAPLRGVGLRDGGTVRIRPGAAFHASPVGPQPTAGGTLWGEEDREDRG